MPSDHLEHILLAAHRGGLQDQRFVTPHHHSPRRLQIAAILIIVKFTDLRDRRHLLMLGLAGNHGGFPLKRAHCLIRLLQLKPLNRCKIGLFLLAILPVTLLQVYCVRAARRVDDLDDFDLGWVGEEL